MPFPSSSNAKPRAILPPDLTHLMVHSLETPPKCHFDSDSSGHLDHGQEGDRLNGESPHEGDVVHTQTAAAYRRSLLQMLERTDPKFSLKEMEELYLARRTRELEADVGSWEEELGRLVASCMDVIENLDDAHKEIGVVRDRQVTVSNGASRDQPFEYEREMQQRMVQARTPTLGPQRRPEPSLNPIAQHWQMLGHAFYAMPNLMSAPFTRLWAAVRASRVTPQNSPAPTPSRRL